MNAAGDMYFSPSFVTSANSSNLFRIDSVCVGGWIDFSNFGGCIPKSFC